MEKKLFHLNGHSAAELSDQQLSDVLFSNAFRIVGSTSQFKKEQPARYAAAQKIARDSGRIGKPVTEELKEVRTQWNEQAQPRVYSQEELAARAKWPLADAEAPLPKDLDAVSYLQRELARSSYGLPTAKSVEENRQRVLDAMKVPEAKAPAQTFAVSREMTERLGLNPSERLSLDSFNAAILALHTMDEEAKAKQASEKARQIIAAEDAAAAE